MSIAKSVGDLTGREWFQSSNNAASQNAAANQQVQQNTQQAQAALQQYLQSNPSILAGAKPPSAPQQFSGPQGGGNFGGGAMSGQMGSMPQPRPQGPPPQGGPRPGGAPPQGGPSPQLAGLLGLLHGAQGPKAPGT